MSSPYPSPGPPCSPTPPPQDDSIRIAAVVVMTVLGVLALVSGVGILLCGGLGYVMTGGMDTGAGAMLLVALLVIAVGVGLLAVPLFVLRDRTGRS